MKIMEPYDSFRFYQSIKLHFESDSYDAIKNGVPIIYQPVLMDNETKYWGVPDLLIRNDVLIDLFPLNKELVENQLQYKNSFNNYFYYIIDIKLQNNIILKNGNLTNKKSTYLNKLQIQMYYRILSKIQGELEEQNEYGFILSPRNCVIDNSKIYHSMEYLGGFKYD